MIYFLIKNLCFLFNMQSKVNGEVEFFTTHLFSAVPRYS